MATSAEEAPLFIKSFFADSVEDTLELARLELGPDALLLNERESRPESRHLGAFEVVFGLRRSAPFRAPVPPPPAIRDLRERIRDLRDALRRNRATAQALARENSRWRGAIEEHLIASGVALPLASDIAADVQERMRRRTVVQIGRAGQTCSTSELVAETSACIASRFEVAPEIGRVSAFIGAPGVGKTTVLVKLALTQGLVAGRKVRLISTDNRRIGGAAQFETYASILGVPCSVVESAPALAQA